MTTRIFTAFVRSLDPSGEPPDAETFDALRSSLRRVLEKEIKGRGLWDSQPSYLGIYGWAGWRSDKGAEGALDELLAECYVFIFVHRLRKLVAHARLKPNIEGLVFLNVRNFLYEAQKRHDPLGFRVFERLRAAILGAVQAEELIVLSGDPRVRNDTILAFSAATDPTTLEASALSEIPKRWNDVLLPDLITARGKARERIGAVLQRLLLDLPAEGVEGFKFKDLIDPLKSDIRQRWAAELEQSQGETGVERIDDGVPEAVRLIRPDTGVEDRDSFDKLSACIATSLEALEEPARTRSYLSALWEFLRAHAAEPGAELPSRRKLAELLRIPRNRMSGLFDTLARLARACRDASFEEPTVNTEGTASALGNAMPQRPNQLEALRRQTGEARRRVADAETDLRRRGSKIEPGDVFLLASTSDLPVEWVILERGPRDGRRVLAIPADDHPMVGSADIAVPRDRACGPLTLRCAFSVWIDAGEIDPELRTGALAREVLEQAHRKRAEIKAGTVAAPASEREVDAEGEYRAWIEQVLEPARAAARERPVIPFPTRRWNTLNNPYALAASVLLFVSVTLGGGLAWQYQRIQDVESDLSSTAEEHRKTLDQELEARQRLQGQVNRLEQEKVRNQNELSRRIEELEAATLRQRRPRTNVPFKALFPGTSRGDEKALEVPPEAEGILLLLNTVDVEPPFDQYRIQILRLTPSGAGREIWSDDHLLPSGSNLSVLLPTSLVPPGEYQLLVYGHPDGPEEPVAKFFLNIKVK